MELRARSLWLASFVFAFGSGGWGLAQDPEEPAEVGLHGWDALSPPEGASDEDASGSFHLRQRDERIAIHVRVRGLEPEAMYEVTATREVTDGEGNPAEESAVLGSITTRSATPSPPRCFKARLAAPASPPEGGEGGGAHHRHRDGDGDDGGEASGFAVFYRSEDGSELRYRFYVRGLQGAVTGASLDLGGGVVLALPLDEELEGSIAVSADDLAALASGSASASVETDLAEELSGPVDLCFHERFRARIAEHLAGSGALRIDTERGDPVPFGVESVTELVGARVAVRDSGGTVVLEGTIGEVTDYSSFWERWRDRDRDDDGDGDGGGGAGVPEEDGGDAALEVTDGFFGLDGPHDASFLRGDLNDDGELDISDPVHLLFYLFLEARAPYCADAADANDDAAVGLTDAIFLLESLFRGSALPAPYRRSGFDGSADALYCEGSGD